MINFKGKHSWSFLVICTVVVLFIFSVNIHTCSSLEDEWWPNPYCNETSDNYYTNGSKFVSNVKTSLNSLRVDVEDTSQKRFNTSVYGQNPNQIYALLQCRGDATAEECYNCSQAAKVAVLQYCQNRVGSRVYQKFCFLRYNGNYNFIGKLDPGIYDNWTNNATSSDPAAYVAAAQKLLSDLSSDITSGSATNRYAARSTTDPSIPQVFALAQCWGDISLADCKTCLSTTIGKLFKDNAGSLGARGLASSCIVQYENKVFFNLFSPTPTPTPPKKSSSKIPIILGVLGGLLFLFVIVFLFGTRKKLKYLIFARRGRGHNMGDDSQIRDDLPNVFTVFQIETLVAATENFHDKNKLGEGGFGAVYKGTIPEGSEIAVKKLSLKSKQGKKEFLNEVKLVAKIQHRNLVKLLGCCAEGSEKLLVYEYLPNNSLDKILFDRNKSRQLDWHKRFSIILGVTRGLLYLHEDSHLRIIHRDIKAGNILLDNKFNPKIADFGLARLFDDNETHVRTIIAGTRGYMAPEYAMNGQLSAKADVYSFGILLLELMSGRKNTDFNLSLEMQILLEWAWGLYKRGNIVEMIDPAIIESCGDLEQAMRCIHVGFLCTQANSSLRPSMSEINLMLSTKFMLLPEPTKPAFVSNSGSSNHGSGAISSSSSHTPLAPPSNADVTITELEPR